MPKIAFLFPGQGAQFVGMGKRLIDRAEIVRELYVRASEILGYDLEKLCLEGPSETLDATDYCQPALFVTSLAALEIMKLESPETVESCTVTAGLSLGEYTSLVFADVLDFEDGVKLVKERGKAMQDASDATPSGMVSILGLDRDAVAELCDKARGEGVLQIANLLCPGNIVVSGTNDACERIAELAPAAGAMKAIPLAVAGAFHTKLMHPADERLAEVLRSVPLKTARIPVISNVDAQPHTDPEDIRNLLVKQVLQPVLWETSMRYMLDQGFDDFHEIGPGRVLRGLMKRIDRKIPFNGIEV